MAIAKKTTTVEIKPVDIAIVNVRIEGDTPLIVHRWDEKVKQEILDKEMGKAKKARAIKRPIDDFCRSMYWMENEPAKDATDDEIMEAVETGRFGFKVTGVKQAAISSAYRSGMTKDKVSLQGAFFIDGEGEEQLVEIKGDKPHIREDMVRVGMGSADIRYRGEFDHWYMDLTLRYNKNGQYSLEQILNILNLGGFCCGIGEWRPEKAGQNGMYHVVATE